MACSQVNGVGVEVSLSVSYMGKERKAGNETARVKVVWVHSLLMTMMCMGEARKFGAMACMGERFMGMQKWQKVAGLRWPCKSVGLFGPVACLALLGSCLPLGQRCTPAYKAC